jgi:hypothetical protein
MKNYEHVNQYFVLIFDSVNANALLRTSSHLSRTRKQISCNHPLLSTLLDTTGDI